MRYLLLFFFVFLFVKANAQYWFGPKIGGHRTDFMYQEPAYKADSFDINFDYGGVYGLTVIYQATERYAVQGDLSFMRVNKKVRNSSGSVSPVISDLNFNYLNLPISFRFNFGGSPIHFFVAGGPVINFWLGGNGRMFLEEFSEEDNIYDPVPYKLMFKQEKGGTLSNRSLLTANRVQYGLQMSAGVYFDLPSTGRVLLDFKYSFGHSNMGFNGSPDFSNFDTYYENFEFRNNTLSVSVAYLFMYDTELIKKGSSTSLKTRQQQKEEKKKNKSSRRAYKNKD